MEKTAWFVSAAAIIVVTLLAAPAIHAEAEPAAVDDFSAVAATVRELLSKFAAAGVRVDNLVNYVEQTVTTPGQAQATPASNNPLKNLRNMLDIAWKRFQSNPSQTAKAVEALDKIYGVKNRVIGFSAILVEAAEQLLEKSFLMDDTQTSPELVAKAAVLVEAVSRVEEGGKMDVRVSKSTDLEVGEAEVSIASVETSGGVVKIYLTEERQRYPNNTVLFTKNAFISVGNTVIIQREVNRNVEPFEDRREIVVGENIGIGAVLNIRKPSTQPQIEKTEYDVVVRDYGFDRNLIRLVLYSQNAGTGRIIIIDVDKNVMREYMGRDVSIRVDGKAAKLASGVTEVLGGETEEPTYFLALTGRGVQIVVYIPTWSTKVVLIGPSSSLAYLISIPGLLGRDYQFLATTAAAATLVTALIVSRLMRPK